MDSQDIRFRYVVITLLLAAGVIFLTHIPQEKIGIDLATFGLDKVLHIGAYALISFFAFLAVKPGKACWGWILVWVVLLVLAGADEITQPFFRRTCSFYDFLADGIGMIGVFIYFLSRHQSRPLDMEA